MFGLFSLSRSRQPASPLARRSSATAVDQGVESTFDRMAIALDALPAHDASHAPPRIAGKRQPLMEGVSP